MTKIGEEFQDYLVDAIYELGLPIVQYTSRKYQYKKGESRFGFEIKKDQNFRRTGNLYIETHEKQVDAVSFVESGILRNDVRVLLIGDERTIYMFVKQTLLWLWEHKSDGVYRYKRVEKDTSRGFLLPLCIAKKAGCEIDLRNT
jgi:hypothetical protein